MNEITQARLRLNLTTYIIAAIVIAGVTVFGFNAGQMAQAISADILVAVYAIFVNWYADPAKN